MGWCDDLNSPLGCAVGKNLIFFRLKGKVIMHQIPDLDAPMEGNLLSNHHGAVFSVVTVVSLKPLEKSGPWAWSGPS